MGDYDYVGNGLNFWMQPQIGSMPNGTFQKRRISLA